MNKIEREKRTIEKMIRLYCRLQHRTGHLCPDCEAMLLFAHDKLSRCPFGESKTACKDCNVHCYPGNRRDKIRQIMRFAGPRMLFYHPKEFLLHLMKK